MKNTTMENQELNRKLSPEELEAIQQRLAKAATTRAEIARTGKEPQIAADKIRDEKYRQRIEQARAAKS